MWTLSVGPGDTDREVIAPTELRPAPKEGEEEVEPTPAAAPSGPTPTPTPVHVPPPSYRSRLANGWDLWITDRLPPQSVVGTFTAAVRDGWRRLRGLGEDHPPAVTLAMADEDARRIHHLMRTGTGNPGRERDVASHADTDQVDSPVIRRWDPSPSLRSASG